jgi:hypothetical protein
MATQEKQPTTVEALQGWREAERTAAVARRGRFAAQVAVQAAEEASAAAIATAEAARSALASATLAEASAMKTATSARLVVEAATVDLTGADSESAQADINEITARDLYHQSADEAPAGRP